MRAVTSPQRLRSAASLLACGVVLAGCRIGETPSADPSQPPGQSASEASTELVEDLVAPGGREGDQVLAVLRYGVARPPAAVTRVDEYPSEDNRSLTLVYLDADGTTLAIQRNDIDEAYDCRVHDAILPASCTADGQRNGTGWILYRVADPASWTDLEMVRVAEAPWAAASDVEDIES